MSRLEPHVLFGRSVRDTPAPIKAVARQSDTKEGRIPKCGPGMTGLLNERGLSTMDRLARP